MKRLIACAVLLSVILGALTLFVGMSSTALAAGTLTVDKPNKNRHYVAGMTYFIQWTPGNAGATVKIELLKAGKRTKWVTKKTANDGEYIWKIPKSVKKNTKYKIKITSTKNSSIYDRSDHTFAIHGSSNWWKESYDKTAVNLGIEDDGSGTWGDFLVHSNTPHTRHAVDVVNKKDGHPVRKGKQSVRFKLHSRECSGSDCDPDWRSSRSELLFDADNSIGDDMWYAWSIYHKNYKFLKGVSPLHGQFKPSVGTTKDPFANNGAFFIIVDPSNGMTLQVSGAEGDRQEVLIPASQFSNQWNDILVHAKWSTGKNGLFKVWVNGKLKLVRKGRNVYANRSPNWFRFGMYRPQIYRATNKPIQIVYYDELVRGSSCDDVSQFMTCAGSGSLKVTSPNGKEKWKTKKKYTIKWDKGNAGAHVKIQLLKSNKHYRWVSKKTKNDGKHLWKVPASLVTGSAYKIKITSTKNKKVLDKSNKNFSITKSSVAKAATQAASKSIAVTTPNAGQAWTVGKNYVIKWGKGNAGAHVKIQLLKSNKHYRWITKKTKNDGKHPWKVPASVATGSAYKIKVTSIKNGKIFDKSNRNVAIAR